MSTPDSKPPRPTLRKPVKPPRALVAPAPVVPRPSPVTPAATPAPSTKKPRFRKPRKEPVAVAPVAAETGERLSKRVMALKDCSRKEAEQYIAGGWVRVNDVVVEEPAHRVDKQTVTLDADATLLSLSDVTLLLNKPAGYSDGTEELEPVRGRKAAPDARSLLTAQTHWEHDPTDTPVLKRHFSNLEADIELENGATGLVVFTQDWRTTRKLTEDMGTMEHEFLVEVKGEVAPEALKPIGYALKDERNDLPPVKFSVSSSTPEMSRVRFAIKGSHPGLVAYLCAQANLEILAMRRIRLGRVTIADLPVGQWRFLAGYEKF
ncbi:S4 domain-containing protein [Rhodoferax saidenbachensis]|uniref:Dual-specificity RNA pseudouridine synthase RluF n=1 Tax=Rhodoferax saidenbachensis TaxID=1484693 RepID=A0ABU1ZKA2_9BURK|nr:S4 domain-containing protein [Rhodoferax saidenbachensis]MDR7305969.1 23S rRNA pseudouridine2604 synthase [Rhodoferax saidenbachensis]